MEEGRKLKRYARRKGNLLLSFELGIASDAQKNRCGNRTVQDLPICLTQQEFNLMLTLQFMSLRVQLCNWDQSKLN